MGAEMWRRVLQLLSEVIDLPPAEAATYLDGACDDAAVRREVVSLLRLTTNALSRVDRPAFELFDRSAGEMAGGRIGPYEVIRELGRGGMGVVVQAVRTGSEDRRPVAIKLLKRGLDTDELMRSFDKEGRILGRLHHANIATLFGAGATDDHRPFLVMEYVDGKPIDRYCRDHGLDARGRVALFRKVCAAVRHAHRSLVVHRDLKPSNILVDGDGEPKLLDFGIAKLLRPDTLASRSVTMTDLRALTPAYASPEQVLGTAITTSSDVYGLGVVLYELLTGRLPTVPESSTPSAWIEAIRDHRPVLPSVAVKEARGDAREAVLPTRRQLVGDLDAIAMTALRKDAERRYPSVEQLDEDLRRFLDRQPVRARAHTWTYRASRLIRRHWRPLAIVAALLLAVGFVVFERARQIEITRQESAKAVQVSEFLLQLFEEADPDNAQGDELTVKEVLDRSAETIENLEGQPALQAAFLNTIGRVYVRLGRYRDAAPLLERALALRRGMASLGPGELTATLSSMAEVRYYEGDYDRAAVLFEEVLQQRRAAEKPDPAAVARAASDLGLVNLARGDVDAARRHLVAAVLDARRLLADDPRVLALTLNNLALFQSDSGDLAAAEASFSEALDLTLAVDGPQHPNVATGLNNLATVLVDRGDFRGAEQTYRQALELSRSVLGPQHPDVANTMINLGAVLNAWGAYGEAEPLLLDSLAIYRDQLGDRHTRYAVVLQALGVTHEALGRSEEAEEHYREALEIRRAFFADGHADVAHSVESLARFHHRAGRLAKAERGYQEAIVLWDRLIEHDHPWSLRTRNQQATLWIDQGRHGEALDVLRTVMPSLRSVVGTEHTTWASALVSLARIRLGLGQPGAALALSRRAVGIVRHRLRAQHPSRLFAEGVLGISLCATGDFESGRPLLAASYASLVDVLPRDVRTSSLGAWMAAPAGLVGDETSCATSRASQRRATLQERSIVAKERSRAVAISASVMPAKKRSSTTRLRRSSTCSSRSSA